jgi:ubiquinone/menaquinone biosynthesis C-methylase UbiE
MILSQRDVEFKQSSDLWADWLLKHRFGGSEDCQRMTMEAFKPVKDKVIENAKLERGSTLLDVGTGDGMIGFGAMEKVGADGTVIFSDISQPLLDVCKAYATDADLLDRCEFVNADATDLSAITSESVEAVTTRSVIIYVQEKQKAFDEFYRVLKPGGRVSMFEPIGKLGYEFIPKGSFYFGYNIEPIKNLMKKTVEAHQAQHDSQSTMSDFDERDLVKMLRTSGFDFVQLELDVKVGNAGYHSGNWDTFYNSAPNPLVPTFRTQVEAALTPEEQERVIAHLKPLVESNTGQTAQCIAYVTAVK